MRTGLVRLSSDRSVPEDLTDKIFLPPPPTDFYYLTKSTPLTIKFVLSGKEHYAIDNKRPIEVSNGNFLVANEGQQVECIKGKEMAESLSIFFSRQLIGDIAESMNVHDLPRMTDVLWSTRSATLGTLLQQLLMRIVTTSELSDLELDDYMLRIGGELVMLAVKEQKLMNNVAARKTSTREEVYSRVHRAREFMLDNLHSSITLTEIAGAANLSTYHFVRSFTAVHGTPPYKYLQKARLEKAMELLRTKQYTVSHVASILKFYDLSYFSNEFKGHFGVRPSGVMED